MEGWRRVGGGPLTSKPFFAPLLKKLGFIWSELVFDLRKNDLKDFEADRLGSGVLAFGVEEGGGLIASDGSFRESAGGGVAVVVTTIGFPVAVFDRNRLGAVPSPPW